MNTEQITIQTTATGRQIRQAMQALLKSQAILSAYKIPHIKHFSLNIEKKTITTNISLLVLHITPKRGIAGPKILDQTLKSRSESNNIV